MNEEAPGKPKKCSLVVKVTLDEQTRLEVLLKKPNTLSMASFCAMLIEIGFGAWEERESRMQKAISEWTERDA